MINNIQIYKFHEDVGDKELGLHNFKSNSENLKFEPKIFGQNDSSLNANFVHIGNDVLIKVLLEFLCFFALEFARSRRPLRDVVLTNLTQKVP